MRINLKHRFTDEILFTYEHQNNTTKKTVEAAAKAGYSLAGVDLTMADLRGANLSYSDLRLAKLVGANLYGATLRDVNLGEADLTNANLCDSILTGSIFKGAILTGTILTAAAMSGAIFDEYLHLNNGVEDDNMTNDAVNRPAHYANRKHEAIDVISDALCAIYGDNAHKAFMHGNALKYLLRAGLKNDAKQDLDKAVWYISRLKENLDP